MFGVDYSQGCNINDLVNAGVKFVVRYVGYTALSLPQTKILTLAEAQSLQKAGIALVSNWEWYVNRPAEGFDAGVWDAQQANARHIACGGPSDRPIYFSVDYDTNGVDCVQYFKGVASVIGLSRTGVYGSYACVKYLLDSKLVTWAWQTYAWSGANIDPRCHIYQYKNAQTMGSMQVDFDTGQVADFGQWGANVPLKHWYDYPISVPFGNPNYDVQYGGSHDIDVAPPPNFPVTSIVSGVVSDISAPLWGKQVGIKLDIPYNGVEWFHYLHLSAVNPALQLGGYVKYGDLIGWVGGGNTQAQYAGTSNPTGSNFTNPYNQSSQIQVGIALMRGPAYGGPGWQTFPPIDASLDPTPILLAARQGGITVTPFPPADYNAWVIQRWEQFFHATNQPENIPARETGIFKTWRTYLLKYVDLGSPMTGEISFDAQWIVQYFTAGQIWHSKADGSQRVLSTQGKLQ